MSIWNDQAITHCRLAEPYEAWVIDRVLKPDAYAELLATFPSHLAKDYDYPGGLKLNLNKTHADLFKFFDSCPIWREFYRSVGDRFRAREAFSDYKFEFSMLPSGGGLLPHTDTRRKAMTGVFYFPPVGWKSEWGGEFEVLRHSTDPDGEFDQTALVPWLEMEPVMSVQYIANRVAFMHRCGHSFHGVRPVQCPAGIFRQSVTVAWLR